jgi:hypothetical protein
VPPLATPRVPVVDASGMERFKEEVATLTQLVPLYDIRLPDEREPMESWAPPREMLLPKVWRAFHVLAV